MSPSPARVRDARRSAVYAAEDQVAAVLARGGQTHEVAGSTLTLPMERRFGDLDSIQRYADRVLSLPSVIERWPGLPPVTVRERAGSRRAHYERIGTQRVGVIAVPTSRDGRWAMREMVVLHEIAHHVTAHHVTAHEKVLRSRATPAEPVHGPTFTAVFCVLTGIAIGPEIELMLRVAFDGLGVPVGSPSPQRGQR